MLLGEVRNDKIISRVGRSKPSLRRDACFLLFKTQPLHGMLYGVLGIALGLALYEIGELRERLDHVEDVLSISAEKEALREEEKAAEKMVVSAHRK